MATLEIGRVVRNKESNNSSFFAAIYLIVSAFLSVLVAFPPLSNRDGKPCLSGCSCDIFAETFNN